MLTKYKKLLKEVDEHTKYDLRKDLITIGNDLHSILEMNDRECNAFEIQNIGKYEQVLQPMYDCFDKAINLQIQTYNINNFYTSLSIIKKDTHLSKVFLMLIGKPSFYDIVSTSTMKIPGVNHFLTHSDAIYERVSANCCLLI
jgi:hypothetical protein